MMDPRIIAALIIGVVVGALGVIMIVCLVIDGGKKNDIRDSGRAER